MSVLEVLYRVNWTSRKTEAHCKVFKIIRTRLLKNLFASIDGLSLGRHSYANQWHRCIIRLSVQMLLTTSWAGSTLDWTAAAEEVFRATLAKTVLVDSLKLHFYWPVILYRMESNRHYNLCPQKSMSDEISLHSHQNDIIGEHVFHSRQESVFVCRMLQKFLCILSASLGIQHNS